MKEYMQWWRDAKFGMFIHWGLYSELAGEWKGESVKGLSEWIMNYKKIPREEYRKVAESFNPIKFNAKEWVKVAKDAGMKYIIITSKHHDGFALYHSKVSDFNIVDAAPFKRDPMKELAEACKKENIKLCFYYSQAQDWYDENGWGNDWDFNEAEKDYDRYMKEKVMPQLKEILTQYGDIGIIWCDTPMSMTIEQSEEIKSFVKSIQPDCIVCGRVGNGMGDYVCLGDNRTPAIKLSYDWETAATINNTFGYRKDDNNWKSAATIIKLLVDIVGKGGTYLLNVGPDGDGIIPEESVRVLKEVGEWLKINEEAIRGVLPNPYPKTFEWGTITCKPNSLYLHIFDKYEEKFELSGLKNKVKKAAILSSKGEVELKFEQIYDKQLDYYYLGVSMPGQFAHNKVAVIKLYIEGEVNVSSQLEQEADKNIVLDSSNVKIASPMKKSEVTFDEAGVIHNWKNADEYLSWEFKVVEPGEFDIEFISQMEGIAAGETEGAWEGGHIFSIEIDDEKVLFELDKQKRTDNPRVIYFPNMVSVVGRINISQPGINSLYLKPVKLNYDKYGCEFKAIRLIKR